MAVREEVLHAVGPVGRLRPGPVSIPLADLELGPHFRRRLDSDHARTLAAFDGEYPPILVSWPGRVVIDGLHRVHAARLQGKTHISCELFHGSKSDELVAFVQRNSVHGLPLTLGERRAAARRLLQTKPEFSDRRIAALCALSAGVVARMRTTLPVSNVAGRTGRDGRVRPIDRHAVRHRIAEELRSDRDASLRQIASRVGASAETVRRVRRELFGNAIEDVRPRVVDYNVISVSRSSPAETTPRDWASDSAIGSTSEGLDFATWFTRTAVDEASEEYVSRIPLSKVYEVADEARRRSAFWAQFARAVEGRPKARVLASR